MDLLEEVIEKAINAEAKTSLQPLSGTREIGSRCPKGYRLLPKKKKTKLVESIRIGAKIKLSPTTFRLLTRVSPRPRSIRKINFMKAIEEII